jgi:hypothetical protein
MRYIKKYEINKNKPQVGDWIICDAHSTYNHTLSDFFENNIGKLISKKSDKYLVKFYELPSRRFAEDFFLFVGQPGDSNKWEGCRALDIEYISNWSKDKGELEMIINAKKYNL